MINPYIRLVETPTDPLGGASGEKRVFQVEFLGKTGNAEFPYTVANEVVSTFIGQALGLNLPNVLTHQDNENMFALIQMVGSDPRMQQGPPVTSETLRAYVETHARDVHGAIVFDLFVANNDRAFGPDRRNLKLDPSGRLLLYDQGNACFYRHRASKGIVAGIPRLDAVEKDMTALFDMDHKGNHYREFLTDWSLTKEWCNRVAALPDFVIEAAIGRIPNGISTPTESECERLKDFLLKRRTYLFEHIERWREKFPGLPAQ